MVFLRFSIFNAFNGFECFFCEWFLIFNGLYNPLGLPAKEMHGSFEGISVHKRKHSRVLG